MADFETLCSLIVYIMDYASEGMMEEGTMTFKFDCKEFHYDCKIRRTIREKGDTDEES